MDESPCVLTFGYVGETVCPAVTNATRVIPWLRRVVLYVLSARHRDKSRQSSFYGELIQAPFCLTVDIVPKSLDMRRTGGPFEDN